MDYGQYSIFTVTMCMTKLLLRHILYHTYCTCSAHPSNKPGLSREGEMGNIRSALGDAT